MRVADRSRCPTCGAFIERLAILLRGLAAYQRGVPLDPSVNGAITSETAVSPASPSVEA